MSMPDTESPVEATEETPVEPYGGNDIDDTPVSAVETPVDDTPASPVVLDQPPTGEAVVPDSSPPKPIAELVSEKSRDGGGVDGQYRIVENLDKKGRVTDKEFWCLLPECTRPNEPFPTKHGWIMHTRTAHLPAAEREALNAKKRATRAVNDARVKQGLPRVPGSHKSKLAQSISVEADRRTYDRDRAKARREREKAEKAGTKQTPDEIPASPVITASETDVRAYESSVVAFEALIPPGSITPRNMRGAEKLRQLLEEIAREGLSAVTLDQ